MLYRPSFRKTARVIAGVTTAASVFATASLLATNASYADDGNKYVAACASVTDPAAHAGCMVGQMDKKIEGLKREQKTLNIGIQAEATVKACLLDLAAFKKNHPAEFGKLGPISRDTACSIAGKLPKPTASAAKPSAG